jgi:hypothetical protein
MPLDLLNECRFPPLAEPYASALREAVGFILGRFEVLGIVASGTIIRGHPGPTSDLDLYVIHARPQRQRLQRWFNGVPAEIFVNPVSRIAGYFEEERRDGRPITAHMLATGAVILERDPAVEQVRAQAREWLNKPPNPIPDHLRTMRYMIGAQVEDGFDLAESNPLGAALILSSAVHDLLRYAFLSANRNIPRDKDLLAAVNDLDPELARLACDFYRTVKIADRVALAGQIADRTIQTRGFFEWESTPEDV